MQAPETPDFGTQPGVHPAEPLVDTSVGFGEQPRASSQEQDGWESDSLGLPSSPAGPAHASGHTAAYDDPSRPLSAPFLHLQDSPCSDSTAQVNGVLPTSRNSQKLSGKVDRLDHGNSRQLPVVAEDEAANQTADAQISGVDLTAGWAQHDGWDDDWSPRASPDASRDLQDLPAGQSQEDSSSREHRPAAAPQAASTQPATAACSTSASHVSSAQQDGWEEDWSPCDSPHLSRGPQDQPAEQNKDPISKFGHPPPTTSGVAASQMKQDGWDDDCSHLTDAPPSILHPRQHAIKAQKSSDVNAGQQSSGPPALNVAPLQACWASLLRAMVNGGCMDDVFRAIDTSCGQPGPAATAGMRGPLLLLDAAESKALIAHAEQSQGECSAA